MSISITDNTGRILEELQEAIETGLEEIGVSAEGYAAANLESNPRRIDTGRLRNSITHIVDDKAAYIGTNVEYAGYVHDGTRKMQPNRFLVNAATEHATEYEQIMERALKGK